MTEKTIDFHYIKSNTFKVVHCDGVWGGATPRGYITINFFSERSPIPQKLTHALVEKQDEKGQLLGEEIDRKSKSGVIREVDVEVIMDLRMAKSLNNWLARHIASLEKGQAQIQ